VTTACPTDNRATLRSGSKSVSPGITDLLDLPSKPPPPRDGETHPRQSLRTSRQARADADCRPRGTSPTSCPGPHHRFRWDTETSTWTEPAKRPGRCVWTPRSNDCLKLTARADPNLTLSTSDRAAVNPTCQLAHGSIAEQATSGRAGNSPDSRPGKFPGVVSTTAESACQVCPDIVSQRQRSLQDEKS
jgi:hypothetical protein